MTTTTNPFALDTPATAPAPAAAPATVTQTAPAAATFTAPATPAPSFEGGDPFDGPAPQQAKGPRMRDLYGRLLLLIPHKLEEGLPNRLGKPGDTQDRMTADVIVLDGGPIAYGGAPEKIPAIPHDKTATVPYKRDRMFLSQAGVISQCRNALAKKVATGQPGMVLGRLSVGEAKGDNNPPYLLTPPTEADKQVARQYLANVDPFG
jgi:hypothetical protein